jgi:hypothetical protein
LEGQENASNYLGINITQDEHNKSITMIQTGLIESIIHDVGLTSSSNTKVTPSDSILHADPSNTPWQDTWNYQSVLGKINFLAQNTHPDISFVVHQCARFCTKPTALHEIALKHNI